MLSTCRWAQVAAPLLVSVLLGIQTATALPRDGPATAQRDAAGAQAADAETRAQEPAPTLQPIAEGEIPARADLALAALRRVEALARPDPAIERIAAAIEELERSMEALRGKLDAIELGGVSTRWLENMRLPWIELSAELARWKRSADARFATLQGEREHLRDARADWELTLSSASERDLGPELSARVEAVLARLAEVESGLRARRDQVSAVVERIASSQELVSEALERIDDTSLRMREEWLSRDSRPLWLAFRRSGARGPGPFTLDGAREWLEGLLVYVRLLPGRVVYLTASFVVLLWAALRLRRRSRGSVRDPGEPDRLRGLLERPFAVALASALVVTLIILPYPTGSASDVILLLALVPVARLGTVLLEGDRRRALNLVVALTLVTHVATVGPQGAPGARLLLLAVSALTLVAAIREVRRSRLAAGRPVWSRLTSVLATLASITLAVALGANVLGWVRLSRALTEGTIVSLFAALGWSIAVAAGALLLPVLIAGPLGRWLSSLRCNEQAVTRVAIRTLCLVAVVMWARSTLIRFHLHDPLLAALEEVAGSELSVGGLTISIGGLLASGVILLAIWLIARVVGFLLREQIVPNLGLRRGTGQSLVTLVNYSVWGIGIAMAASAAGISGTQLAVVIGALGVGIGFGLQTIVNNFVSGLILIFERPIKVGDTLEMPGYWGTVVRIGIRASVIRSFDGAEISVPNGDLISREVVNWTGTDEIRRAEVLVGVSYGSDPEEVLEILRRVAREHPRVRAVPEVKAQMIRFGESALEFRLRFWTLVDDWIDLMSDLHVAIHRELKAAGITIPFPQRDLHIRSTVAAPQPEAPERPAPE